MEVKKTDQVNRLALSPELSELFSSLKIAPPETHILSQDRDRGYDTYYHGMDTTRRQKVAFTTAHFKPSGAVIGDMGFGTGATTSDFANLYRNNHIIGFDIDPHSVASASAKYQSPNLHFVHADIGKLVLPPCFDGFLNSSILHEVASYGAGADKFSTAPIRRLLSKEAERLHCGGKIVIRDFVEPSGPREVILDLPNDNGVSLGDVKDLSTTALFKEFCRTFKSSRYLNGGLDKVVQECGNPEPGWSRFQLPFRDAAEFLLRKDYTDRWHEELQEEYIYWSQKEFEDNLAGTGLRIIVSQEVTNPWIVKNRFEGQFRLFSLAGQAVDFPPTNFIIVGEKIDSHDGARFETTNAREIAAPKYLGLSSFKNVDPGSAEYEKIYEVVTRPNQTVDLLPWFRTQDGIHFLAKEGYPRPIVNADLRTPSLSRTHLAGYISEPVSASLDAASSEDQREFMLKLLYERAGITPTLTSRPHMSRVYFPSPGGCNDKVISHLQEIEPLQDISIPHVNYSNLSTSGTVRPIEARQALRAFQVGGMFDSRLEINIYSLMTSLSENCGPWIGSELTVAEAQIEPFDPKELKDLLSSQRRAFQQVTHTGPSKFLKLMQATFEEKNLANQTCAQSTLEFVVPKNLSSNTISILPIVKSEEGPLVGVEVRDLPVPQIHGYSSTLLTVPSFRLPLEIISMGQAKSYVSSRMKQEFGVEVSDLSQLGGDYFPSSGVTPEKVYPYACTLSEKSEKGSLIWVKLSDLLDHQGGLVDAHLLTAMYRSAHALSLI